MPETMNLQEVDEMRWKNLRNPEKIQAQATCNLDSSCDKVSTANESNAVRRRTPQDEVNYS